MATSSAERLRREGMQHYGFGPEAMKKIKVCARCGTMSPASSHLCHECKAALSRNTLFQIYKSRHLFCKKCQTVVPDESKYCPSCGTKLTDKKG